MVVIVASVNDAAEFRGYSRFLSALQSFFQSLNWSSFFHLVLGMIAIATIVGLVIIDQTAVFALMI